MVNNLHGDNNVSYNHKVCSHMTQKNDFNFFKVFSFPSQLVKKPIRSLIYEIFATISDFRRKILHHGAWKVS